jgi:hypothetical protein
MRYFDRTIICALVSIAFASAAGNVRAQDNLTTQSKIVIDYGAEPTDPQYRAIYQDMRRRQVFERLQRFLAPVRFTRPLAVKLTVCGDNVLYRPYQPGGDIAICYEFIKQIAGVAPPDASTFKIVDHELVDREATIVGPVILEILHDVALAVFDRFEVPVWGRAEDAADNVAALIMLQFGPDVARSTILGAASFLLFAQDFSQLSYEDWVDVRPVMMQRYYNVLCVAYGSNQTLFSGFVPFNREQTAYDLPRGRANSCVFRYADAEHPGEYEGAYEKLVVAFKSLVLDPYVDPYLMKQVLAIDWVKNP